MITKIIERLTIAYLHKFRLRSAYYINSGHCEEFAEDVCDLMFGAIALWNDELAGEGEDWGGHKVIEYAGRYYDCECPNGVKDWRDIPFFKRLDPSPLRSTQVESFHVI